MQGQRTVAPLVREDVVLRGIERVDARHHVPFAAQHVAIAVLHLVGIADVRQGMMAAHQSGCFQRPQLTVVSLHQQVLVTNGAVLTVIVDGDMQAFAPCSVVMYGKLQFHLIS